MNCEEARKSIVAEKGFFRRQLAQKHVRKCLECSKWLSDVRNTSACIRKVQSHEMPESFERKLQGIAATDLPERIESKKEIMMRRLKLSAVSLVVLAVMIIAALTIWLPGMSSVAWADLERALTDVQFVHITARQEAVDQKGDTHPTSHKDKWIRREPLAVYEEITPVGQQSAVIVASNTEQVYWYFPERHKATITNSYLKPEFMSEVYAPFKPSVSSDGQLKFKVVDHSEVDGRKVILLRERASENPGELTVDAETKLALRYRYCSSSTMGKPTEYTVMDFKYNETPPSGIFEWKPPAGVDVVDKRSQR